MEKTGRLTASRHGTAHETGAGHFGHKTFRHQDTSAPQNWTGTELSIGHFGPGAEVSGTKALRHFGTKFEENPVHKCLVRVRSVLWPKCPV